MWVLSLSVFAGCCIAWAFFKRGELETSLVREKNIRSTALIEPLLLPAYILIFASILLLSFRSSQLIMDRLTGLFLELLLVINVYYVLLLCLLPLLRRVFSPRACATLWILPNSLYLLVNLYNLDDTSPLLVLTIPRRWLTPAGLVWLCGFVVVLLWQVLSHLRYRRLLLRASRPVEDPEFLSLWDAEQRRRDVKRPIPVLVSPQTHTPLTIGLFNRTQRLVLPHTNYTPEELELIFAHEARHIQRCDTRTKAFLGFCTAMCWFNPFLWISRRKVSSDLELSCDELVLHDADETKRKQYANLLLNTAGDSRGYTTCLSAAASSLRYRLKHVVTPKKRLAGTLTIGIVLFALMLSGSTIALADSPGTVQTLIYDQAPSDNRIDRVYIHDNYDITPIYGYDEAALTQYLASLSVRRVYSGNFGETAESIRELDVIYTTEENGETTSQTTIELYDGYIYAYIPFDDFGRLTYLVDEEIDWDYVQSLLDFDAPNPDPAPQPPELLLYFEEIAPDSPEKAERLHATKTVLSIRQGGVEQQVSEHLADPGGVGGVFGFPVTQVQLSFSYAPIQNDYQIRVENWDRTASYTVSGDDLTDELLELAPYSAHYTVCGAFETVRDTTYEMNFFFDVELPEE